MNEIRQVTEEICLKGQGRAGKGGRTNKQTKQNSRKQEAGVVDSWRDYAIVTAALT